MSKSKDLKKTKELRRNLEILKAQLKDTPTAANYNLETFGNESSTPTNQSIAIEASLEINDSYIKRDILKTFVLSVLAFGIIAFLKLKNPF